MTDYKIVLADDHAMFREGINNIINVVSDMKVIGEASDGLMLLKLLKRVVPDMVILDVSMPKLGGIEVAQEINKEFPDVAILFLSMHKNTDLVKYALKHGYAL